MDIYFGVIIFSLYNKEQLIGALFNWYTYFEIRYELNTKIKRTSDKARLKADPQNRGRVLHMTSFFSVTNSTILLTFYMCFLGL